jgi:hypothetical protein
MNMSLTPTRLGTLITALLLLPAALRAQEGVTVFDFANGSAGNHYSIGTIGKLRRGTTSSIRIARNLIDLLPEGNFTVTGGTREPGIIRGRNSGGTGFIQIRVSVAADAGINSAVTVNVGDLVGGVTRYEFKAVRKAMIRTVIFSENPVNIPPGRQFLAKVQGEDLGDNARLSGLTCHNSGSPSGSETELRWALARSNTCTSLGPFTFEVVSGQDGYPFQYATSAGTSRFQFGPYLPCPLDLGAPVILSPSFDQVFVLPSKGDSIQSIQIVWRSRTDNGLADPRGEWLVRLPERVLSTGPFGTTVPAQTKSVRDTMITEQFRAPGSYNVFIRPNNCGSDSHGRSAVFTLRF